MTDPTPTNPTPPQGLTDARLLELAAGKIEFYDRIEPGEYEAENECALEVYGSELIAVMRAAIAAHEAARAQLRPNYIDPEHTGEDRELLEAFYVACRAEGGTADEIVLRGIRAAIAADRANRPTPSVCELVDVATDLHRVASDLSDEDLADSAHTCRQAATLLEQFRLGGWIVPTVEQVTPDHEANHLRDATKMALTPEEVEARFRAWWAECYPNVPAGGHTVRSHVAFALHLMGGEVAA